MLRFPLAITLLGVGEEGIEYSPGSSIHQEKEEIFRSLHELSEGSGIYPWTTDLGREVAQSFVQVTDVTDPLLAEGLCLELCWVTPIPALPSSLMTFWHL